MKTGLKKGSLSAAAGLALCFALLPAEQAHATTFVPCNDIQALVDAIEDSNTTGEPIALAPGCTYTLTAPDNDKNGLPVITGDVRISAQGATIRRSPDATVDFRIFQVAGGASLRLTRVTLSGGRVSPESGGGILNQGTLNLTDSTVSSNQAENGGGIHNDEGQLNLARTTVQGNQAGSSDGGGIWNAGGTMTMSDGALRNNNSATFGGGLSNFPAGTATFNRTTISGNGNNGFGGGINNESSSTLTLNSATVRNNEASFGGGIRNDASTAELVGTQVTNNTATGGPGSGGGIFEQSGEVTLIGGSVTNNTPDNCAPDGSIPGCTNPTATATSTQRTPELEISKDKRHRLSRDLRHAS